MRLGEQRQLSGSRLSQRRRHQHLLLSASIDAEPGSPTRDHYAECIEAPSSTHGATPPSPRLTRLSGFCRTPLHQTSRPVPRGSERPGRPPGYSVPLPIPVSPALHAPAPCDHATDAMDKEGLVIPQYGRSVADLYHTERNHQGLGNRLIIPHSVHCQNTGEIRRTERLGGMLNYSYRDAA